MYAYAWIKARITGFTGGAHPRGKNRIYDACVHPLSDLDQGNCGAGTTLRNKHAWVINTFKMPDQLPAVETPTKDQEEDRVNEDVEDN